MEHIMELNETITTDFIYEMYKNMQFLNSKCDAMQSEIDRLNMMMYKKQKIRIQNTISNNDIPNLLNALTKPKICWKDYKTMVSQKQMKYIFEYDMIYSIQKIIEDDIASIPLTSYNQRANILYIYDDKWLAITDKQFNEWLQDIHHQILKEFLKWKAEEERILMSNNDEDMEYFVEKCMKYLQRIIGGNKNKDNEIIFKWLCKKLKNI